MMLYPVTAPPSFSFHVVEVMSSPKYHLKEVGYLASEGAFPEGTEEVVLTVNGIKKVSPTSGSFSSVSERYKKSLRSVV